MIIIFLNVHVCVSPLSTGCPSRPSSAFPSPADYSALRLHLVILPPARGQSGLFGSSAIWLPPGSKTTHLVCLSRYVEREEHCPKRSSFEHSRASERERRNILRVRDKHHPGRPGRRRSGWILNVPQREPTDQLAWIFMACLCLVHLGHPCLAARCPFSLNIQSGPREPRY